MSSRSSSCAACKFLRRKCMPECEFAPYFPSEDPHSFACVHSVFGAKNVSKLLRDVGPEQGANTVMSLTYEAEARLKDPVYGCVGFISFLQQQLKHIQRQLIDAKKELASYVGSEGMQYHMHNLHKFGMSQQQNVNQPNPLAMGNGRQLVIIETQEQRLLDQELAAQQFQNYQQLQIYEQFNRLNAFGVGGNSDVNIAPIYADPSPLGTFDAANNTYQIQHQPEQQQLGYIIKQQGEHQDHNEDGGRVHPSS